MATVLAYDAARRLDRLSRFALSELLAYAAAAAAMGIAWACLLLGAAVPRPRHAVGSAAAFVLLFAGAVGSQEYFFRHYNVFLTADVAIFSQNLRALVLELLVADAWTYLTCTLPAVATSVALVVVARRTLAPVRPTAALAPLVLPVVAAALFPLPVATMHRQRVGPDALYVHGLAHLATASFGWSDVESTYHKQDVRHPLPVPPLAASPHPERNVLMLVLESVRAASACGDPGAPCERTPFTHRAAPARRPLLEARALAPWTALSLPSLWGGVLPTEPREVMLTAPLLFDYAHAAGWDAAYWTSQNLLLGTAGLWLRDLPVSQRVSGTELDPEAELGVGAPDALLVDHVLGHLDELSEPFFAVVHVSNTYTPYRVDPGGPAPFSAARSAHEIEHTRARYENAVYQQDKELARLLTGLRSTAAGRRTVVVYVSDHGESFGEHELRTHGTSLYDEQLHVPAWIDAPPATLTPREQSALDTKREADVFHVDFAPTVLDLMGVLDAPALRPFRARMPGTSLLRAATTRGPLPLTNTGAIWSWPLRAAGLIEPGRVLVAHPWHEGALCHERSTDPEQTRDSGSPDCERLRALLMRTRGLPTW